MKGEDQFLNNDDDDDTKNVECESNEKEQAEQLLLEISTRMKAKLDIRSLNQNASLNRPDEGFFRKLDSALKKNTAYVKKLGKLTEQQRTSLINEFETLNLTRYVQEIASTLVQSKLKMSDIPCAVHICSLMHQRYADFTGMLFTTAKKIFQSYIDDKPSLVANASKLRTDLRFVSDLTVSGIFSDKEGLTLLHTLLVALVSFDKSKHDLLHVVISLCKHSGEDLAGLVSKKNKQLGMKFNLEIPRSEVFSADKQKYFHNVLIEYWESVRNHLLVMHKSLQQTDRRNQSILQTKGELHEEKSKELADKQAAFTKLQMSAMAFADLLDVDLPDLPENDVLVPENDIAIVFDPTGSSGDSVSDLAMWEDEDQKSFYNNLLDLKEIIPAILFKDSGSKSKANHKKNRRKRHTSEKIDSKPMGPKVQGKGDMAAEEFDKDITDIEVDVDDADLASVKQAAAAEAKIVSGEQLLDEQEDIDKDDLSLEEDTEEEEVNLGVSMKVIFENFISSLKNCVNRELVDKAAQDFCMNMNTRANRKRLARALFNVHRSRLDLLPFYARLAATLSSCVPDVSDQLSMMLLRDFRFHIRKKDQIHIESKVKTMRFIGEMTKFGLISTTDCLNCLKILIQEFSPHAIEMACALLETCGYFILRNPDSHLRAQVHLTQLLRLRTAKVLDQRYATMIDNARYTCDPPKVETVVAKKRPPMHEYIRKLLFRDLSKSSVERVLRQMRKLPWKDPETRRYIAKCLSLPWLMKYNNIHCLASLVAGLAPYRDEIGHTVVDDVLENIRIGMEINHPRYNQRRVSNAKLLGELYNYRMVESTLIFNVLYSLITFGVSYDIKRPSTYDPPDHLFRIRLVCVLLETCGQYFDRGSSKKKLDCFIPYLQRYIWMKKSHPCFQRTTVDPETNEPVEQCTFPVEVDYLVQDTLEPLRPKLQLFQSFQEAQDAVSKIERELFSKLAKVLPQDQVHSLGEISTESNNKGSLNTISEMDEEMQQLQVEDIDEDSDATITSDHEGDGDAQHNDSKSDSLVEGYAVRNSPRVVKCDEDEEFMKAFDSIMAESMQSRKQTQVIQHDMTVPVNMKRSQGQENGPNSEIKFSLLIKKGNKPTLQPLRIPVTEQLASGLRDRTQAEKKQKEELKMITLSINERQVEEEQHQIDMAFYAKQPTANTNRDRRPKYTPPKGAPNADLIFSSGGRRK